MIAAAVIYVSTMMPPGVMAQNVWVSSLCTPGYSQRVRPPAEWTNAIKERSCQKLGLDVASCMAEHELDHRDPIEDGGCPNCADNLWLQAWPEAKMKDEVENWTHRQLCLGTIGLEAVPRIMEKWKDYYSAIHPERKPHGKLPRHRRA
jgi:hypothetical protein